MPKAYPDLYIHTKIYIYIYIPGTPRPTIYKWMEMVHQLVFVRHFSRPKKTPWENLTATGTQGLWRFGSGDVPDVQLGDF